MSGAGRRGFSLLEVMLATTVLLGSVIVLSHIAFVGDAHLEGAEQYSAAQLACQTRMNEMLAGAAPLEEVSGQPIPELPGWGLTVKVSSADQPGLLALEVTAAEVPAETIPQTTMNSGAMEASGTLEMEPEAPAAMGEATIGESQAVGAGKRFTLVRWIADPESSAAAPTESSSEAPSALDGPAGAPVMPDEAFVPEEPPLPEVPELPEQPSLFDEPLPEF